MRLEATSLQDRVPEDHPVRALEAFLQQMDLSRFEERIRAREHRQGRPAWDPRILLLLWVYATSEGVGSARRISTLCERDDIYRWICGGVPVNHHALSDFRAQQGEAFDELLSEVLAVLMNQGLVTHNLLRAIQWGAL